MPLASSVSDLGEYVLFLAPHELKAVSDIGRGRSQRKRRSRVRSSKHRPKPRPKLSPRAGSGGQRQAEAEAAPSEVLKNDLRSWTCNWISGADESQCLKTGDHCKKLLE
ncbi:hypothetical protein NDU88_002688 [Pleurodeles waltl]|uniref:Uncharacterized protein n=1 Tax=Pleurodeles waltl TaxID=8319 RepID=A0AAV7KUD7_PLEWA|nr:hypothetical protein NDU88_002688 [Pleurodeles waltl]